MKNYLTLDDVTAGVGDIKSEREKLPDWLVHSPLMNIHAGLNNSGTADYMLSAIEIFLDHAKTNIEDMETFFSANDVNNLTIKCHALKGTSKIIGAMILSTMAGAMEKAGIENDIQYINSEFPLLMQQYKKYEALFLRHKKAAVKTEISSDDLTDAIMALKEYVNAEDFSLVEGALDYLDEHKLPRDKEILLTDIRELLYKLDWEGMHALVEVV